MHMYVKSILVASAVAWLAHTTLTWHGRYRYHSQRRGQYEALLRSELCTDPQHRLESVDVNNCNLAQQNVNTVISPATMALLETVQTFHLCAGEIQPDGQVGNRCEGIVAILVRESVKIGFLLLACICAFVWMWRQYCEISNVRRRHLPLDYAAYPSQAQLPPWPARQG